MKTRNKPRQLPKVSCKYGAPMGMCDILPPDVTLPIKLHLVKQKWVDGDYLKNGAYFGGGSGDYIFWAYSDFHDNVEVYVRCVSRKYARIKVLDILPNAKFYN